MNEPIKIIHKYKNKNRKIQYNILIFVGNLLSDSTNKVLKKIKDKNLYDTLTELNDRDLEILNKEYGANWYKYFFIDKHIRYTFDKIIKNNELKKKDIIKKYGQEWYNTHIDTYLEISKIVYSYQTSFKNDKEELSLSSEAVIDRKKIIDNLIADLDETTEAKALLKKYSESLQERITLLELREQFKTINGVEEAIEEAKRLSFGEALKIQTLFERFEKVGSSMDTDTEANSEKYRMSLEQHIELELKRSFETIPGFKQAIEEVKSLSFGEALKIQELMKSIRFEETEDKATKNNFDILNMSLQEHITLLEFGRSFETIPGFEKATKEVKSLGFKDALKKQELFQKFKEKEYEANMDQVSRKKFYELDKTLEERKTLLELERSFETDQGFDKLISELKTFKRDPEAAQELQRYIKKLEEKISDSNWDDEKKEKFEKYRTALLNSDRTLIPIKGFTFFTEKDDTSKETQAKYEASKAEVANANYEAANAQDDAEKDEREIAKFIDRKDNMKYINFLENLIKKKRVTYSGGKNSQKSRKQRKQIKSRKSRKQRISRKQRRQRKSRKFRKLIKSKTL
jgi:hypothetical protein